MEIRYYVFAGVAASLIAGITVADYFIRNRKDVKSSSTSSSPSFWKKNDGGNSPECSKDVSSNCDVCSCGKYNS